jgi:hypothetical protein
MENDSLIIPDGPLVFPYQVTSHEGDIYRVFAEFFKQDSGGFAFYIGNKKVAWFDYKIVKAIFILCNTEEKKYEYGSNEKSR